MKNENEKLWLHAKLHIKAMKWSCNRLDLLQFFRFDVKTPHIRLQLFPLSQKFVSFLYDYYPLPTSNSAYEWSIGLLQDHSR